MPVDLNLVKIDTIHLGSISSPTYISKFFRNNAISEYVYSISYIGTLLKYGHSTSETKGDRVVRQLQHIHGWGRTWKTLAGRDFVGACDKFKDRYGLTVDRSSVILKIYDVTNYPGIMAPSDYAKALEAQFLHEYYMLHGELPIGNIRKEPLVAVNEDRLTNLFTF